jgi:hypothetical protein
MTIKWIPVSEKPHTENPNNVISLKLLIGTLEVDGHYLDGKYYTFVKKQISFLDPNHYAYINLPEDNSKSKAQLQHEEGLRKL